MPLPSSRQRAGKHTQRSGWPTTLVSESSSSGRNSICSGLSIAAPSSRSDRLSGSSPACWSISATTYIPWTEDRDHSHIRMSATSKRMSANCGPTKSPDTTRSSAARRSNTSNGIGSAPCSPRSGRVEPNTWSSRSHTWHSRSLLSFTQTAPCSGNYFSMKKLLSRKDFIPEPPGGHQWEVGYKGHPFGSGKAARRQWVVDRDARLH